MVKATTNTKKKTQAGSEEGVRKRRTKDPNAPKRPNSAYICFSNAIRGQVKQANPGLDQASTMSRIAEMWRSMDQRQKAKYEAMAAKDQQRYQAEKANYVPPPEGPETKKGKAKKDPNAPKRPNSAYICFSNAVRPQVKQANPGLDQASTMSRIAEMWRSMDQRQKAKYDNMAAKDQQRYQAEKANYVPPPVEPDQKKGKAKKDPNAPKRPNSAYICFSNAIRGQVKQANPGLDQASTMSRIAEMWRSMDARQKAKYENMAAKDQQRYQAEKAAYEKKTKGAARR